eukprot:TRINITY_DN17913_c0_g1_i1.p1 TRINITY_DN17913_c0_g1~~TRINITY_DN17913_c0_g1_i1.p1  ORF type:complete len:153 (+),score=5.30 TRINITY_DN17913_c0_g1_i1:22-480(+)
MLALLLASLIFGVGATEAQMICKFQYGTIGNSANCTEPAGTVKVTIPAGECKTTNNGGLTMTASLDCTSFTLYHFTSYKCDKVAHAASPGPVCWGVSYFGKISPSSAPTPTPAPLTPTIPSPSSSPNGAIFLTANISCSLSVALAMVLSFLL